MGLGWVLGGGRNAKTDKLKNLLSLTVARLAILSSQHEVLCSQARSSTAQLLQLNRNDHALLRVEQMIREQNHLDIFVMIEGYCRLICDRTALLELEQKKNNKCPDELREAASSLIFAASRNLELPELHDIRRSFTEWFGKEFVTAAIDLRADCGVNPTMIQKLSTKRPEHEAKIRVLREIAMEKGINFNAEPPAKNNKANLWNNMLEKVLSSSNSFEEDHVRFNLKMTMTYKYKDVGAAALDAYESATYAAAAARAAVELARSEEKTEEHEGLQSLNPNSKPADKELYNHGSPSINMEIPYGENKNLIKKQHGFSSRTVPRDRILWSPPESRSLKKKSQFRTAWDDSTDNTCRVLHPQPINEERNLIEDRGRMRTKSLHEEIYNVDLYNFETIPTTRITGDGSFMDSSSNLNSRGLSSPDMKRLASEQTQRSFRKETSWKNN